jgi:hypothetical protein
MREFFGERREKLVRRVARHEGGRDGDADRADPAPAARRAAFAQARQTP